MVSVGYPAPLFSTFLRGEEAPELPLSPSHGATRTPPPWRRAEALPHAAPALPDRHLPCPTPGPWLPRAGRRLPAGPPEQPGRAERGRGGQREGAAPRECGQARPLASPRLGSPQPSARLPRSPGLFVGGCRQGAAAPCPPPRTASTARRSPKPSGKCGTATGTCSPWAPAPTEPSGERAGAGAGVRAGLRPHPGRGKGPGGSRGEAQPAALFALFPGCLLPTCSGGGEPGGPATLPARLGAPRGSPQSPGLVAGRGKPGGGCRSSPEWGSALRAGHGECQGKTSVSEDKECARAE